MTTSLRQRTRSAMLGIATLVATVCSTDAATFPTFANRELQPICMSFAAELCLGVSGDGPMDGSRLQLKNITRMYNRSNQSVADNMVFMSYRMRPPTVNRTSPLAPTPATGVLYMTANNETRFLQVDAMRKVVYLDSQSASKLRSATLWIYRTRKPKHNNVSEITGPIQLYGTGLCMTVMKCFHPNPRATYCDPSRSAPVLNPGDLQSGAYIKMKPCLAPYGNGTEQNRIIAQSFGQPPPDTRSPTKRPTKPTTKAPTRTKRPTLSFAPSPSPFNPEVPSAVPTSTPTSSPIGNFPTASPTGIGVTNTPTFEPTSLPTPLPTFFPTLLPTLLPSAQPTHLPTSSEPTSSPTKNPEQQPPQTASPSTLSPTTANGLTAGELTAAIVVPILLVMCCGVFVVLYMLGMFRKTDDDDKHSDRENEFSRHSPAPASPPETPPQHSAPSPFSLPPAAPIPEPAPVAGTDEPLPIRVSLGQESDAQEPSLSPENANSRTDIIITSLDPDP